jgi:hypothetical protein
MIKIGIPVVDEHELTLECIRNLDRTSIIPESVEITVIDNGSEKHYAEVCPFETRLKVNFIRLEYNTGFYYPLSLIAKLATSADIVGVMHNDLTFYEQGWDRRLMDTFLSDGKLGMVGVCGSNEIDDRGGRGGGTMSNFRGTNGQLQEHTGRRETGLYPALIFDSMFMAMRKPVVDCLEIDEHIVPCHFMDKLWPVKAIKAGWKCAVLGLEVDHQGGRTSVGSRFESDCALWCDREKLAYEPGRAGMAVYLEAERQFLTYGRANGFIPSKI